MKKTIIRNLKIPPIFIQKMLKFKLATKLNPTTTYYFKPKFSFNKKKPNESLNFLKYLQFYRNYK